MNKWLQSVLASLVLAIALALRWADPPVLSDLRALVFDQYQRVQPREYKDAPVKIVDIDDESLIRFGQWPWPRSLVAQLLQKLREQGAVVVAMDIVFSEPDRTAPSRVFSGWGLAPDDELSQELALRVTDPDEDLAAELKRGNVVLGVVLTGGAPPAAKVKRKGGFANYRRQPARNRPRIFGRGSSIADPSGCGKGQRCHQCGARSRRGRTTRAHDTSGRQRSLPKPGR